MRLQPGVLCGELEDQRQHVQPTVGRRQVDAQPTMGFTLLGAHRQLDFFQVGEHAGAGAVEGLPRFGQCQPPCGALE